MDFIGARFMRQHVMVPTFWTSDENMIDNVSLGEHSNTSSHQVVRWGLVIEQTQEVISYVKRPNFLKADYNLVRNKLI